MGISVLRVINDEKVLPGYGFAMHSHQDMEIITYVKKGTIECKDNMDNLNIISTGEIQLMSSGTGVTHSEYNPSSTETLEFLQIWIKPNVNGIAPNYQQMLLAGKECLNLVASPSGKDGSILIHQNIYLYQLRISEGQLLSYSIKPGRVVYVHVISGSISVNAEHLYEGDGATIKLFDVVDFIGADISEVLVFELP